MDTKFLGDNRPTKGAWESGNYWGKCDICSFDYTGDKRSRQCADCAYGQLYRYQDSGGDKPYVGLMSYSIASETPKGYWIQVHKPKLRFVLKSGFKRFAHDTIDEAKKSFIKRKIKQLEHLVNQTNHVNLILAMDDPFISTAHCNGDFSNLFNTKGKT